MISNSGGPFGALRRRCGAGLAVWLFGAALLGCGGDGAGEATRTETPGETRVVDLLGRGATIVMEAGSSRMLQLPPSAASVTLEASANTAGELHVDVVARLGVLGVERSLQTSVSEFDPTSDPTQLVIAIDAANAREPNGLLECTLTWDSEQALTLSAVQVTTTAPNAEPERRPNVLFITIDTLAAEHLSLYGYGRETSPRLDAFAQDAVVFENVWANAPWTLPSYLSQLAGIHPEGLRRHEFDVETRREGLAYALPESATSFVEIMRANGYRTAGWVDNAWLNEAVGFAQGFELFDDGAAFSPGTPSGGGLATIVPAARDWIAKDDGRPYFAFVHCLDVHAPYPTDADGGTRFEGVNGRTPAGDVLVTPIGGMFDAIPDHVFNRDKKRAGLPERADPLPLADRYDEGIAQLDATLGRFLESLDDAELLENTIVMISSDHGESVGQHGWYFDHALLYEDTLRVPLIVRLPPSWDGVEPGRILDLVEMIDVFPTLMDLCAIEGAPNDLDGVSLAGHLTDALEAPPARPIFASGMMFDACAVLVGSDKAIASSRALSGLQTLISDSRGIAFLKERAPKLFEEGDGLAELLRAPSPDLVLRPYQAEIEALFPNRSYELYNLASDPGELRDLSATESEVLTQLIALIEGRRATDAARRAVFLDREDHPRELGEAARAILDELGYVDALK